MKHDVDWALLLEYLKAIFSWPIAVLFLGLFFFVKFKKQIEIYLTNISGIKLPGGVEIMSQSEKTTTAEKAEPPKKEIPDEEIKEILDNLISKKEHQEELQKIQGELQKLIAAKDGEITYWEFLYLSLYLVTHTKQMLVWIAKQEIPVSRQLINTAWAPIITLQTERTAVIEALLTHQLIIESSGLISITPKGNNFIRYFNLENLLP